MCVCVFRECVRFCFTQILQHELDTVRQEWNDHPIRRQNGDEINGRPEILYQHPDLYGAIDANSSSSLPYMFNFMDPVVQCGNERP
ncbi:hypothetical protein MAR_026530 [Mya arenaria]|uniref:Uncharacterized protein n=1 Tax=Mya arenaria TaxID=6604 RepID=A0ABY7EQT6_MYAAR|nr:hypothetical protein MAR_026530 [Mya arenaria]